MKKPRRSIVLIASIYAVAVIVLLLAVAVFTGILPLGIRPAVPAATEVARAAPMANEKAVPALRPIWPAGNETRSAPRDTRTPTPAPVPTQVPATFTWTPAPEPVAWAPEATADATLPAQPAASPAAMGGRTAPGMPSPAPDMPTLAPAVQAGPTPTTALPAASPIPGAPTLGPEAAATDVPNEIQTGPSATPQPSATPAATIARPMVTNTATATATATGPVSRGQIEGKILIAGQAPTSMMTLTLETQAYEAITHTSVMIGTGAYIFTQVPDSSEGYNLVFAQAENPGVEIDKVATWAWVGRVPIDGDAVVTMPDFDIGLRGLRPINPASDKAYDPPLLFTWNPYSGNGTDVTYWMDLYQGQEQQPILKAPMSPKLQYTWDGKLNDQRVAGKYWWGIGAHKILESYEQVVYTYLTKFSIK